MYVHRRLDDGDIYFVNNRRNRPEKIQAVFRVSGYAPELWHADGGLMGPASYRQSQGRTIVPLDLAPQEAVFVVFKVKTHVTDRVIAQPARVKRLTVSGPWSVHFQEKRGAPDHATFNELRPWNTHSDEGIRYFSGTARYETTFEVPDCWTRNRHLEINLGSVRNVAEVKVNGHSAGVLWERPFEADISSFLHPGSNLLEVRVTNTWVNRLIGDQQPNAAHFAFSSFNPYRAESPLNDSGLLGPVTIEEVSLSHPRAAGECKTTQAEASDGARRP
jgi:hypothetical protein